MNLILSQIHSLHILISYFMTIVWVLTFHLCVGPPYGILLSDFPPETLQAFLTVKSTRGAGKSLARPPSRCILFDGENISFDASLVIYI
jgi:hypothetical protein